MQTREDYYAILRIERTATLAEIRRAYRALAKEYHPDKNPENPDAARALFEQVTRAYRTLADPHQRLLYDRQPRPRARGAYRPTTPEAICQNVFELLLNEQPEEALQEFDRFLNVVRGSLDTVELPRFLEYADARDCEFLLAEAFECAGRREEAVFLYEKAYEREQRRPYFRAFTEEIEDRLKALYFDEIRESIAAHRWDAPIEEALHPIFRLGVTRRERAGYYKALAEMLESANRPAEARESLLRALAIAPKLGGVKKLCRRLNVEPETWQFPTQGLGETISPSA